METVEIVLMRRMTINYDGNVEAYPAGARVKCYKSQAGYIVGGGGAIYAPEEKPEALSSGDDPAGVPEFYTEELLRASGWDSARALANERYNIKATSWDHLIEEFLYHQELTEDAG